MLTLRVMPAFTPPPSSASFVDAYGQRVRTHSRASCVGGAAVACCVHRPSSHRMASWPRVWRDDRGQMFRLCPKHAREHPDPDDLAFRVLTGGPDLAAVMALHDCCGCCASYIDGEVVVYELEGTDGPIRIPAAPSPAAGPLALPTSLQAERHAEHCAAEADTCFCVHGLGHEAPHECACGGRWSGEWGSWTFVVVRLPKPHRRALLTPKD